MADVHNFISEALKEGHPIEDIVGFLGSSESPEDKAWAQRWQATAAQPAYQPGGTQDQQNSQPNTSMLEDFSNLSTPAKLATGAGVLAGTSLLGAGAYAGKKAIDIAAEVRKEKALSQIEPSAAVKVQQGDLALRQAQFEATRNAIGTGEVQLSPVEQIKLEREKLKLEADRQKLAREAELHTQKITQMARQQELAEAKAKAATTAAAAKQTVTASGAVSPQDKQMLESSIVAKTQKDVDAALKAQKAVAPTSIKGPELQLTPPTVVEAPITDEIAKVAPVANEPVKPITPLAGSAPAGTIDAEGASTVTATKPVAIAPPPEGMRSQYTKNKANPIGPGAFNHLVNNLGLEKATEVWEGRYGKTNVPYQQFVEEYSKAAGKEMHGPVKPLPEGSKPGGAFGKPEFIPEYIRGSAPIEAMARTGLAALGIMPIAQKLKQGDFKGALNEAIPASALIDPRLSLALSPLYTSEEEIATLKKAEQGRKVGAGRGIAPPSAYQR
jgi:hypothetical protein